VGVPTSRAHMARPPAVKYQLLVDVLVASGQNRVKMADMPRPRSPHGTKAAYKRHKVDGDRICDACTAWKEADLAGKPFAASKIGVRVTPATPIPTPERPKRPKKERREVDLIVETLDNLQLVEDAMVEVSQNDPARLGPLSKRRSELLEELITYGGAEIVERAKAKSDEETAEEKLDSILDGDLGDNVSRFTAATA
jgi:hypothetical protein